MRAEEIIKNYEDKIAELTCALSNAENRCDQYEQAYDALVAQIKQLQRSQFGKKSERFVDPENPQLNLLDPNTDKFAAGDSAGNAIVDTVKVPAHERKKKIASDKQIPVRIEIIPVHDEQKKCSCGKCKKVIRYESKKMIHRQPAVHEIIDQRREVVACEDGCDSEIITAPAPLHVLPKIKATEEFLAYLVISKLDDRQPLYHLENNY